MHTQSNNLISKLDPQKVFGFDSIPGIVLKKCASELALQ